MSAGDLPLEAAKPQVGRRLLVVLPLMIFFALAALFLVRLGAGDPSRIPSALIGRAVPAFALPPLSGRFGEGLTDADLRAGHVTLVNVFASWCVECHDEHGALMALAQDPMLKREGVALDGIVYKDNVEDARRYLGQKGDPYERVGNDTSGRTAIDFGVYGVPETFVIRADGTVAYKLIGPVTQDNAATLMAEIQKATRGAPAP